MGQSYRIKTELGVNKTINVQLDQDFEFLEILSLKIQQTDVYTRSCADYGVLVGRVIANGGFGVPNARVSVFIPITVPDQSNPLISSIYPYKSPTDKNEDGYRYNLLPYEKSYSKHAATGTLPTRIDSLTGSTAVEIYDKYYKFTAKTNESGDYMIMGVPLGNQSIVMDVDLSDIGEFSLTPQDLIRMGLATEGQVAGNKFRTSTDLKSLPQIINIVKSAEISPLWGDPTTCQIAVNRLDFDLRDEANVEIQPTSVFMGSMFSSSDGFKVRDNCKPRDDMGNLCGLTTGPGQILAIRQTIRQDSDGNPVLEQYDLEQAGNVIDASGTWLIEVPMNLDYFITNEFGEKVISYDPTIGIPTKGKYRFKVKWTQPNDLTLSTRRPYFLIPNVKEYGWTNSDSDPTTKNSISSYTSKQRQQLSSYYFGLAWSGYTDGFNGQQKIDKLNESIDCNDTFYQFEFNRVYTVSSFIDQWKKGGNFVGPSSGNFIGIKEIDSFDCEDTINKFPVNDGFKNFDLLYFLFSIIFTVLQPIGIIILTIAHILLWLYNLVTDFLCWLSYVGVRVKGVFSWYPFKGWRKYCNKKDFTIKLPMITYPECQACDCSQKLETKPNNTRLANVNGSGNLSLLSDSSLYEDLLSANQWPGDENSSEWSYMFAQAIAGNTSLPQISNPIMYKMPISQLTIISDGSNRFAQSYSLPPGERINLFNQRSNFFTGLNKIKVTVAKDLNAGKFHYDNTLTVLSQEPFDAGTLITFINLTGTTDMNYTYSATTTGGTITGISGESYNGTGQTTVNVSYAINQLTNSVPVVYNLPYGSGDTNYKFPADIEYFQVVTAITVANASKIWNTGMTQSFGNILSVPTPCADWRGQRFQDFQYYFAPDYSYPENLIATSFFEGYQEQYVLVLQRGVDPYSPKYRNEYSLGKLFGTNESDPNWTFTAETRINIPIQKLSNPTISIQGYSQPEMFYQSYFFKPATTTQPIPGQSFTGYNTTNTAYYGSLDANGQAPGAKPSLVPNNPGTTGGARRLYYYGSTSNSSSTCNISTAVVAGTLFVPVVRTSPVVGLRLYQNYTQWGTGVYTNPLNGGNLYWKINWNGAYYNIKVKPNGYIESFTSCPTPSTVPNEMISMTTNAMYSSSPSAISYDGSEDVSGMGIMSQVLPPVKNLLFSDTQLPYVGSPYYDFTSYYYTRVFTSSYNTTSPIFIPITISTSQLNVMRTDRLPSSDVLDGGSWDLNPSLLQQNLNFAVYQINTDSEDITSTSFTVGAQTVTADLDGYGQLTTGVLESFNCESMVGLKCYQGFGTQFGINQNCPSSDAVEGGCYMFLRVPLTDLVKDYGTFAEWGFRFRFFYALCRGVLSQSFMNNWINGTLYAYPIQVTTYYNNKNKAEYPRFCMGIAYYNQDSQNFYYRSSPWNDISNKFVGKRTNNPAGLNGVNLLNPTTIVNLGMKDYFYSEITFDPTTKAYIMPSIDSTSYADTSDLVNLFVISRITDETFLAQIIAFGDNGISQLFSRDQLRVDGDFAQLTSINSEIGNVNFSPQFYEILPGDTNPPTNVLGSPGDPAMAVWFSSTTQDLQTKDYLTPGIIDFRSSDNLGYYPYPYGIKSQLVPFYQWGLADGSRIFGNQKNNWKTGTSDIIQNNYQSLDRVATNTKYFLNGTSVANDLTARAYIFSVDGDRLNYPTTGGKYINTGQQSNNFLVGAPFQFYFGPVKGASALDRFKTKYSVDE